MKPKTQFPLLTRDITGIQKINPGFVEYYKKIPSQIDDSENIVLNYVMDLIDQNPELLKSRELVCGLINFEDIIDL